MKTRNLFIATLSIVVAVNLTSCRGGGEDGAAVVIEKESFIPRGLPEARDYESGELFCFTTDSCGFCVSNMALRGDKGYRYIVSESNDGGHKWKKLGSGRGKCRQIEKSGDYVFLETILHGEQDTTVIMRSPVKKFRPKPILKVKGKINSFHAFNESTFIYFKQKDNTKGTYRLTTDSGRNWKRVDVPGIMFESPVKYSEDKMYVPLLGGLYIKDINSGKEMFFRKKGMVNPAVSGQRISFSGRDMWEYDGKHMDKIHDFISGNIGFIDDYVTGDGDLLVAKGAWSEENKEGKKFTKGSCLLYSVDGGYSWESMDKSREKIKSISSIPYKDGIAVICSKSDSKELCIVRIRKAERTGSPGSKRPLKRLRPTKEIPDSLTEKEFFNFIFGDLTEFYEDNVWKKSLEDVVKETKKALPD